ncbi:LysR substrate-binding domain-containing protein, partial [Streptomyces hygroscopicus]|uniref:LysR substrate-binding domain-containing protein n=1 Tax=Streptomyces hygroscopicus TaxID=1912 RepID=UPI0036BE7BF8
MIARTGATAPNVRLSLLAEPSADQRDPTRGQVDLEIGASEPDRPEISSEVVGTDRMVLALRRGHPLAKGKVDADKLGRMSFVTVSRRGRLHGAVDDAFAERGLRRRVIASLPTSAAALVAPPVRRRSGPRVAARPGAGGAPRGGRRPRGRPRPKHPHGPQPRPTRPRAPPRPKHPTAPSPNPRGPTDHPGRSTPRHPAQTHPAPRTTPAEAPPWHPAQTHAAARRHRST